MEAPRTGRNSGILACRDFVDLPSVEREMQNMVASEAPVGSSGVGLAS